MFNTIDQAIKDLKNNKMIIVTDNEDRENEGDFIMPCANVTSEHINFMITHGRGLICAPISKKLAQKLELPLMVPHNTESMGTAFTVSIDAKDNITTGISSSDRAHTLRLLSKDSTPAASFVRPGHIFPLIARSGGVLEREGHTEAAIDFAKLAGFDESGVICEILNSDGTCARRDDLLILAEKFNLSLVSIAQLKEYLTKQGE
jgi:3,4-dihydroxy 2-butanone 4-phosphate synthase/GTP cyclohydrolase II